MNKTLFLTIIVVELFCNACHTKAQKADSALNSEKSDKLEMDGLANNISRNHIEEIKKYDSLINLNPKNPEAYYARAFEKIFLENYNGAIEDLNEAIIIRPNYTIAYFNRGDCNLYTKNYKSAIQDYNKVLELIAGNGLFRALALEHRSVVEERLKDYKSAIADMTLAIKDDPDEVYYYYHLANLKNKTGDYEGSILVSNSALKIEPNSHQAFFSIGLSYYQLKIYKDAIEYFDKCIATDPKFSEAFYYRGLAKFYSNQKNMACDDWHKAAANGYNKGDSSIKTNCK